VTLFGTADGVEMGNVTAILAGTGIWVGGDSGISHFDGKRFIALTGRAGHRFEGTNGIVATDSGDLWLNGDLGISHIAGVEVRRALRDPSYQPEYEVFDQQDGLSGTASQIRPLPTALAASDGRLWFMLDNMGVVSIWPGRLRRNRLVPPVKIWSVTARGGTYNAERSSVELPEKTTSLELDYTAGSLTVPERVRFRYRLDGLDKDWQDGGNRREAFYTNLSPGEYVFHVIASNNDGLWNEVGASLRIRIKPAWFQTGWFHALCVFAALGVLAGWYRGRLARVRDQTRRLLEARLSERERIARDLHDTLLQSMQGLMLRFRAVTNHIPENEKARGLMERALERAGQVLIESRDSVKNLRRPPWSTTALPEALADAGRQLEVSSLARLELTVEGERRKLHPIVHEEAFLIGREALANAIVHSQAHKIEVEVSYGPVALKVRVRDDGTGIESDVLTNGGRAGRWGIVGMRERAAKIRGQLHIWSKTGAGTEVELSVPAKVAYGARMPSQKMSWWRRVQVALTHEDVIQG
jgi:signal transduction histidine kinase